MKKLIVFLLILILMLSNLAACSGKKAKRYEASFLVLFDTMTSIVAYSNSKEEFNKQSQYIYDELKKYHELYDIYHDYKGVNNLKTINDQAGIAPVKVDRKIIDLLLYAKKGYTFTNGQMNVAFGAVLKLWHEKRTQGIEDPEHASLPDEKALLEAKKHTENNKIIIDEANSTVYLADRDMSLDVGAVAKGYATEQVALSAIKHGFTSGILSVGGNVRTIGKKEKKKLWNIGIENPEDKNDTVAIVYLKDKALVTSGIYERYYTVKGKQYHHIVDPDTLYPAQYYKSVTILCNHSGMADELSTAVFNMPFEQGKAFVESLPDVEALWIFHNGEIKYSGHFQEYMKG